MRTAARAFAGGLWGAVCAFMLFLGASYLPLFRSVQLPNPNASAFNLYIDVGLIALPAVLGLVSGGFAAARFGKPNLWTSVLGLLGAVAGFLLAYYAIDLYRVDFLLFEARSSSHGHAIKFRMLIAATAVGLIVGSFIGLGRSGRGRAPRP